MSKEQICADAPRFVTPNIGAKRVRLENDLDIVITRL
jgi:hypothetical protein